MSITADNMIEVTNLKAGQRVIQVDGKWVAVGVGGAKASGNTGTSGDNMVAGVLVEGDTGLMFQELAFDGTTPSNVGDPVSIEGTYLYNTGKDEPEYGDGTSTGGSMEIYKCAAVHEATAGDGYVITGAGVEAVNGTYTTSTNNTAGYLKVYVNENGVYLGYQDGYHWEITDQIVNWYYRSTNGEDPTAVTWSVDGGTEPLPTITKVEGSPASWDGYKYNIEAKQFSDTLTEGLEYKMAAPIVGQVYNEDATMLIDLYAPEGLVFYAPFNTTKNTDETGVNINGNIKVTEYQGVQCLNLDGYQLNVESGKIPKNNSPRTLSFMVHETQAPASNTWPWIMSFGPTAYKFVFFTAPEHPGLICIGASGSSGESLKTITTTKSIANGWVHVTVSYDGNKMVCFEDGVYTGESVKTEDLQSDGTLVIGNNTKATAYFKGYLSEVKVWNRALSAEEITSEADRCMAMVTE